jgi:multidrug efflux pump subunit AcrB
MAGHTIYPGVSPAAVEESVAQVSAIYSPKGTRDALFLSNYAKINIVDTLKRVPGVGDATQWAISNTRCGSG